MIDRSASRKADREVMADEIVARVMPYPSITATKRPGRLEPRETAVDIEGPRGVAVTVSFNGARQQPNMFVLSWHFGGRHKTRFSGAFEAAMGEVNPYHRHKCTTIAMGWFDLVRMLERGLDLIESRDAFEPEEVDA